MSRTIAFVPAIALMLAACGDGEESAETDETENAGPQGEVRGGTISDAMLPIAMVESQSPQRGGGDEDAGSEDGDGGDAE